jgi:hypothetical protein
VKLKAEIPKYNAENLQRTVKDLYDAYIQLVEKMEHMFRHLEDENIDDISANKITAGIITASVEMLSAIITGGLIRTAKDGKRLELSGNQIKCYNSSNQFQGFVIDDDGGSHYGDVSFYSNGVKALTIYNAIDGFDIRPCEGYCLIVGDNAAITYFKNTSFLDYCSLEKQLGTPTNETDKIKLYYDGTDLKAMLPDGTVKTVTLT